MWNFGVQYVKWSIFFGAELIFWRLCLTLFGAWLNLTQCKTKCCSWNPMQNTSRARKNIYSPNLPFFGSLWNTTPNYSACEKKTLFQLVIWGGSCLQCRLSHGWDWGTREITTKLQSFLPFFAHRFTGYIVNVHCYVSMLDENIFASQSTAVCGHHANPLQLASICSHHFLWKRAMQRLGCP